MEPARVVHLNPSPDGYTGCCGRTRNQVRHGDRFTLDWEQVTCNLANPPRMNSIINREAALKGRAQGALGRLLEVRARLDRASPQVIDDKLRKELLRVIDWGLTTNDSVRQDCPEEGSDHPGANPIATVDRGGSQHQPAREGDGPSPSDSER